MRWLVLVALAVPSCATVQAPEPVTQTYADRYTFSADMPDSTLVCAETRRAGECYCITLYRLREMTRRQEAD